MILLKLLPVDMARFCLAYPQYSCILSSASFMRKHARRYDKFVGDVTELKILKLNLEERQYKSNLLALRHCRYRTESNHCWNCLLSPILLTFKPQKVQCYCMDHMLIWLSINNVVIKFVQGLCKCFACTNGFGYWTLGDVIACAGSDEESEDDDEEGSYAIVNIGTL